MVTPLFIKKIAANLSLVRPAPEGEFPLDGTQNFISPGILFGEDDRPYFLIRQMETHGFSGEMIEDRDWRYPASIPYSHLEGERFVVKHWYPGGDIQYIGYRAFLWGFFSALATRLRIKNWFSQRVFEATTKFRHDRIYVLKRLVALDLKGENDGDTWLSHRLEFEKFMLFGEVYGARVYGSPVFDKDERAFSFVIDSLIETGELKEESNNLILSGKALDTISRYEKEERRHRDNIRHNWLIFSLTLVIAFATAWAAFHSRSGSP